MWTLNNLINLKISSLLKSSEHNLAQVKNSWLNGSKLSIFKGVNWSAKNLMKIFAFVLKSETNFWSIKKRYNQQILLSLWNVLRMDQYVLIYNIGLFNFFPGVLLVQCLDGTDQLIQFTYIIFKHRRITSISVALGKLLID